MAAFLWDARTISVHFDEAHWITSRVSKEPKYNNAGNFESWHIDFAARLPYETEISGNVFNPQVNTRLTRVVATAALALVIVFGVTTYNYIQTARYGTVSQLASSTLYEHHDLMVGFDTSGKISLLGRSAFAAGYYSVAC